MFLLSLERSGTIYIYWRPFNDNHRRARHVPPSLERSGTIYIYWRSFVKINKRLESTVCS